MHGILGGRTGGWGVGRDPGEGHRAGVSVEQAGGLSVDWLSHFRDLITGSVDLH